MEGGCAGPHRLVEEVFLPLDVGVEGALLHPERLGEITDRSAVVTLLRE
jgi:hypothetical protein